ncbi:MAG: winged helix-turn-helix transcriptional regulator [Candidatus Nanopelagicales bacterium]
MSGLILITNAPGASSDILPALALLNHSVKILPANPTALIEAPSCDVVLIDARKDLPAAKSLCKLLNSTGLSCGLILITTEGGLIALNHDWGIDDVLLDSAGPAEVDTRIRLVIGKLKGDEESEIEEIQRGDLSIDEASYTVKLRGEVVDLTFKEFELLRFLAQHPGRVFSRAQLLQEVWGFDYFGGTRTVDVHVRRLRAKLGSEYENLIGTIRNVGYRFVQNKNEQETKASNQVKA